VFHKASICPPLDTVMLVDEADRRSLIPNENKALMYTSRGTGPNSVLK